MTPLIGRLHFITMAYQVMHKVSVYGVSDIGLVRQNNEDSWMELPEEQFFVLADGMGGHRAGEIASKEAAKNLCSSFQKQVNFSNRNLAESKQLLRDLIQKVNQFIYQMGCDRDELKGMGTTLCCIFLHPEGLIYGHVGDSRIYLFRNQELKQLTQDHSLLQELIDLGQLNTHQAEDFLYKNIITKAIGTEPYVEPSIQDTSLEPGDIILMCTDGLSDLVSHKEIQQILSTFPQDEMAKQLVEKGQAKRGPR